jgi:hypothetical protein
MFSVKQRCRVTTEEHMPPCFQIERITGHGAEREDFGAVSAYSIHWSGPVGRDETSRLVVMGRIEDTPAPAAKRLERAHVDVSALTLDIFNDKTRYCGPFKVMHFDIMSRLAILWSVGEIDTALPGHAPISATG